ncbi:hypothetical protein DW062_10355 [Clostridium sp. AF43-10]|nr:hypothetical protein DW062_10355 [Clostridium sp. AF43-10]
MTDSERSEEEVHVLDSQIIRIDRFEAKGRFSSIQLANEEIESARLLAGLFFHACKFIGI